MIAAAATDAVAPRRDFKHLDFWRIEPLALPRYRLGAFEIDVDWCERDHAFVRHLIPTPQHGCRWTDAEALGLIDAAIPKEAAKVAARINRRWRDALARRAGDDAFEAGVLVWNFNSARSGGEQGFAFHDGVAWMSAFRAAVRGGVTGAEAARLNALLGRRGDARWRVKDLHEAEPIRVHEVDRSSERYRWKGMAKGQPLYDAIVGLAAINNDEAYEWGDLQIAFGWGWLSNRKKKVCAACGAVQP